MGVILRLFLIIDIPINYKFIKHTHSHIALLGWAYTALTTLIYYLYLKEKPITRKYYKLFWATQFTLIGMLISFPITGYALLSIIFSTLFLIASYWFFWFVNKHISTVQKETNSYKLIRVGLWFMVISSIGPWILGVIMNTLGGASIWYRISIYFYLHFQYNGWFVITLFGVFFYILEQKHISISKKYFNRFFWLMIISVVLTFMLSVLWAKPHSIIYYIGTLGAFMQILSLWYFIKLLNSSKIKISISLYILNLLKLVFFLFIIKIGLQFLGSFRSFSNVIAVNIDLVIGYLHWTFLGVVSISIFAFLHHFNLILLSKKNIQLYVFGFFLTEVLIFYKGFIYWKNKTLPNTYNFLIIFASCILLLSIIFIFYTQLKRKPIE